ncbi:hypothetical protein [Nocardia sp. CC227C]|uniref:hypothetical protein n=1 Tax=Nocardia sp. CC227C TaxID=3044562 RepID=UPI00278C8C10|nr:hypothetical protein [Nocardia sp. CC227C]
MESLETSVSVRARAWLRDLHYAPTWVLTLTFTVAVWTLYAVFTPWLFAVVAALLIGATFSAVTAVVRGRYGGRRTMRAFFDAVHARELPDLHTDDEIRRWHRIITAERVRRRRDLTGARLYLIGAFIFAMIAAIGIGGRTGISPTVIQLLAAAWFVYRYFRVRSVNTDVLATLEVFAEQGTQRGYGRHLPENSPAANARR